MSKEKIPNTIEEIREAWAQILEAPQRAEDEGRKLFREIAGAPASSIVPSAEGYQQFSLEDGDIKLIARQALSSEIIIVDSSRID